MNNFGNVKIEISLQDAHRLVVLIEQGNFPAKAFEDGRGAAYGEFKRTVIELINTGGTSTNVVSQK